MIRRVQIASVDTSKLPVLSKEEKEELLIKVKQGDKEAREKFISGNLKLVLSVIQKFTNRGENVDDLFQVGCVGLIKALDNFDISLNVQFSTYAVPMIIGELKRHLRDNNPIRVSRSMRDLAYRTLRVREQMRKEKQKEPTIEELAKEMGIKREEIVFSLDAIQNPLSLQEPVYNDGTENLYIMDQVKDLKDSDERWTDNLTILEAIKKLNEKEKNVIKRRFFDGKTQVEVAEEIGISQAQVSRLEKSAINRIRKLYE